MFRRRMLAAAMSVAILFTTTAVQAAPQSTVTFTAEWTSGAAGDLVFENGSITVTETPDGVVSLSFDISRTTQCLGTENASTTERWQATGVPASLSTKNNLSSATAVATVTGGFSITSSCFDVVPAGDVGLVTVETVATARTLRERTADGARILTRSVEVAIVGGSVERRAPGEIQKTIG